MKRKTIVTSLLLVICMLLVFSGGLYVGIRIHRFDFLCVLEPEPSFVTTDLHGEHGMIIPAGTIVAKYSCEYADRFSIEYVLPHGLYGLYANDPPIFEQYIPTSEKERLAIKRGTLYQNIVAPKENNE